MNGNFFKSVLALKLNYFLKVTREKLSSYIPYWLSHFQYLIVSLSAL